MYRIRILGLLLLVIGVLSGVGSYCYQYSYLSTSLSAWLSSLYPSLEEIFGHIVKDYSANFSTELVSIGITVLAVDALYRRYEAMEEMEDLKLDLSSTDNRIARMAARKLHLRKRTTDGSLRRIKLYNADLHEVDLCGADLRGAEMIRAILHGARMHGADLRKAKMGEAKMAGIKLGGADLNGASLCRADLRKADLRWATLTNADLREADLTDADLTDADLSAVIWGNTTCPDGTNSGPYSTGTCEGHLEPRS